MCGLTGIIFGKKQRNEEELDTLKDIFTTMFILSEERGHHASGIVSLSTTGKHNLYKLPIPPSAMINQERYEDIVEGIDDTTTILMGHSRWRTVGTEFNNRNNQPIVAGSIIGSHNGTVCNHKQLFQYFQFPRFAEVDSEILFRMADASLQDGVVQTSTYRDYLTYCDGSLSCVFVSKTDPESVYLFHGDKPLFLYYNPEMQVLIYSSSKKYIESAIDEDPGWLHISFPEYRMYQTCFSDFGNIISEPFFCGSKSGLVTYSYKDTAQRAFNFSYKGIRNKP